MNEINANTEFEDIDFTDYPYLGIGKKPTPNKCKFATDDQIEKIIGG